MEVAALGLRVDSDPVSTAASDLDKLTAAAGRAEKSTGDLGKKSDSTARAMTSMDSAARGSNAAMSTMAMTAVKLGAALGAALSVRALQMYADAWSDMQSKVGSAVKNMQAAPELMRRIVDIANASYSPLEQTVDIYTRNVGVLGELGRSATEAADFTEALNHALVITATKGQQAESVQNALSKAMAVGKLQAMGLEAVLANGGRVAEALAKELGTGVNGLRAMASQGKITSDVIASSLIGSLEGLREEAGKMPATMGDAFGRVQNNVVELVGRLDQASGASGAIAEKIVGFADGIRTAGDRIIAFGQYAAPVFDRIGTAMSAVAQHADIAVVALAGFYAPAVIGGIAALTAALGVGLVGAIRAVTAAMLANPVGLIVAALVAAGYAVYKFRDDLARVFGVDIVAVTKLAANTVIGSFVAAYEDIKFVWNNFGDMMGGAVIGGVNLAIAAINGLIQGALSGVNSLVDAINNIPGLDVSRIGEGLGISEIENPYADRLAGAIDQRNAAIEKAMTTDYIGMLLGQKDATEALDEATDSAAESQGKINKKIVDSGDSATKKASDYDTLTKSIRDFISQTEIEIAVGNKASKAAQMMAKYQHDLASGTIKLTEAQKANVAQMMALAAATESAHKIEKIRLATQKSQTDLSAQAVRSLRDEVDKNRDLAATFGMSASAIEKMTAARLADELVQARAAGADQSEIAALEALIALRHENAGLLQSSEARDADIAQWKEWEQEIGNIFDQAGQSLADAIFEGGKSGRDLVKSLFKTLTFKVLIQPVMNAMQGQVTQQLGGMFGGQQQQGQAGSSSGSFDFNSLSGGSLGNTLSSFGSTIGSTMVSEFGAGLTAGAGGVLSDAGASALMNIGVEGSSSFSAGSSLGGAGLGSALGYLGAIYSATQGQYGSAAGMAIGTAILPGIGTAIGGLLGGLADGLFNQAPKTRHGKTTQYELTAADEIKLTHNEADDLSQDYYEAIAGMTRSAVDGINNVYAQLGIDANVSGFWARTDASKTGKGDGVSSGGGMIVGGEYRQVGVAPSSDSTQFGFGGWSDAPMLPRLAVDVQMTMLEAFQAAADLMPKSLATMFEGVNIRSLGAEQVQALAESFNGVIAGAQALQAAAEALPFENLKNLSFDAAAGLMALAGGLDNLIGLQSSFIDNFYTDAEKQALQIQSISAALSSVGVEMPEIIGSTDEMKAAYRALVDAQDVNTEAGQRAYVALLATGGAFADLAESAGVAADAVGSAAVSFQAISDALKGGLSSALDAVTRFGQEEIARLRQSSSVTDQAMQAFRSAAQGVQNEWRGLITAIDQGIKTLRAGADDAFNQDYTLARARISTALVTGQVSDKSGMADAVKIAQQGVTRGVYASQFDQEKAYLILANELEGLKNIAQPELDTAAATLAQLEDQYALLRGTKKILDGSLEQLELQLRAAFIAEEAANIQIAQIQSQIDVALMQYNELLGIKAGIQSLSAALTAFAAAADAVEANNAANAAAGGGSIPNKDYYAQKLEHLAANPHLVPSDYKGAAGDVGYLENYFESIDLTPLEHWERWGKDEGLKRPGFAVGTPFVPYDMAANIHKGEIIIDPRSSDILRRYGIGVQGGGNAEVVTELRGLREQNAQLEKRLASIERTNAQLADQFDMVSAGGNALATEVMA